MSWTHRERTKVALRLRPSQTLQSGSPSGWFWFLSFCYDTMVIIRIVLFEFPVSFQPIVEPEGKPWICSQLVRREGGPGILEFVAVVQSEGRRGWRTLSLSCEVCPGSAQGSWCQEFCCPFTQNLNTFQCFIRYTHCHLRRKIENCLKSKFLFLVYFQCMIFFFFSLFPPPLGHMEVPGPGIRFELELQPMRQLQQGWILNPLVQPGFEPGPPQRQARPLTYGTIAGIPSMRILTCDPVGPVQLSI